jgi:hypothetical protein
VFCVSILFLSSLPLFVIQNNAKGQSTPIFTDGFESGGFSAWTGVRSIGSGAISSVQTAPAYSGAYAMKAAVADGNRESGTCIYKDLGGGYNTLNARVYVQISSKPAAGGVLEIFGFSSDGWLPNAVGARVDIENDNGAAQWRLNYYSNGWQTAYAGSVNPNTWYCVEVKLVIGNGSGETRLYINGAELVAKTGLTNTAPGSSVRYFSLGVDDESGGSALSVYLDSATVSSAYIGPQQPSSPTPTPTPTTSPTATPTPTPTQTPVPTPTPTPPPSGLLFQDGFESGGFNSWTTTGGGGTYTQTVEVANSHHGARNAKFTAGANSEGWAQKAIPASPVIYLQQYIKLGALPSSGNRLYLGTIQNTDSNNNVDVYIENGGGQYYWGVYTSINGAIYHDRESAPSNLGAGVYYCVETCRDAANSRSRLWVDGALKVDVSRPHVGYANGVYSGISWTTSPATVYVDCVKVSTSYIQPETPTQPTPTPTPTPTTAPTPTPSPTPPPTSTPVYREASITKQIQASWIAGDGTLYAGSGSVLYKSPDQGVTWQPLLTFSGSGAEINCVFVNRLNYIFASPTSDAEADSLGLWRSTNGGQTWTKVLPLSAGCSIWSMTQDSSGNLFAGIYTTGSVGNATIFKSTDGGAHWTIVYHDTSARHIHCVTVDLSNNYVYAAVGDVRVNPNWYTYVIRATDDGAANGSWRKILTLPQMLSIEAVYATDQNGRLASLARIFATDYDNGQLYRTTDDVTFNLVLDTGTQSYGYWIRTNSLNGDIYASFTGGEHPVQWVAGIWVSSDDGVSWTQYKSFPIHYPYYGSVAASNFFEGTMYYSVQLDSGLQNGIKIYPDYGGSSRTQSLGTAEADVLPLGLGMFLLSSGSIIAAATLMLKFHGLRSRKLVNKK